MKSLLAVTLLVLGMAAFASAQGRGQANRGGGRPEHAGGRPASTQAKPAKPNPGRADAAKPAGPPQTATQARAGTPTKVPLRNPNLQTRLQKMLGGADIEQAAAGFRNWGQFVAAVHVSNNLNIPFADLKSQVTGSDAVSLGQAIQNLKGSTEGETFTRGRIQSEVKRAEDAADADLRQPGRN